MIAAANRDIRRDLDRAHRRRHDVTFAAFTYLDELLEQLEAMHLNGRRFVPGSFVPKLLAVNELLPSGVKPLRRARTLIRFAIDDCFAVQECLQAHRMGLGCHDDPSDRMIPAISGTAGRPPPAAAP